MTYTGVVVPGGQPDSRTAGALSIAKLSVDPEMHNNCYLLTCVETGDQVLIDAADEPDRLLRLIGDGGLTAVVTTHQHWDHHRALRDVVLATGAEVIAGAPDAAAITEQTGVEVTRAVVQGDEVAVGTCRLQIIAIAGHTPGSIALVYDDSASPGGQYHLFTGDSLFPGGVGNTFGNAEAFAQLIDEVETKVFGALPDNTWFYPGHGGDSTLAAERPSLPEWRDRGW
jgi:glyoxylase-like metal-dependent hydrolase (beta-lactamase superfamily II)